MNEPTLYLLLVVALLVGSVIFRIHRARNRLEIRARLLEALAGAVRRELPLAPLVRCIVEETRPERPALKRLLSALEEGADLAEAFRRAGEPFAPPYIVESLRGGFSSGALADVLDALAEDAGHTQSLRHRIFLALAYPTLLLPGLLLLQERSTTLQSVLIDIRPAPSPSVLGWAVTGAALLGGIFLAVSLLPMRRIPAPFRRLLTSRREGQARFLRLVPLILRADRPLPEALRRSAGSAWHPGVIRRVHAAADRLEDGDAAEQVWPGLGLPAPATARLSLGPAAKLPARFREASRICSRMLRTRVERRLRMIHPVAITVFGLLLLFEFRYLMTAIKQVRETVMPW